QPPLSPLYFFLSYAPPAHPDLHSFPTRRSSDLFASRPDRRAARIPGRRSPFLPERTIRRQRRAPRAWRAGSTLPRRRSRASRARSEEHTSELQSLTNLVCRLLLDKKKTTPTAAH